VYNEAVFSDRRGRLSHNRRRTTLIGVGKAAYTLFNVPEHDYTKSQDVARRLEYQPQLTVPELSTELTRIRAVLHETGKSTPARKLDRTGLLGMTGVMMQFTSYIPELRLGAQTPFSHVDRLYQEITDLGKQQPLSFSEQLEIAIRQTEGDVPEALWRLFIVSRLHARWYDSSIIIGMPEMDREEVLDRMLNFSIAVRACKEFDLRYAQDSSGDAYYCWTHALAKIAYGPLAQKNGLPEHIGGAVVHNGTRLMHGLAHRIKKQHLPSNHERAADYGNKIGHECAEYLTTVTLEKTVNY
jgi:hypothetical protein